MKYLYLRHYDFWWVHYGMEDAPEKTVSVWIYDDNDRESDFFEIEVGTVSDLEHLIEDMKEELKTCPEDVEIEEYEELQRQLLRIKSGEAYYFLHNVYFDTFSPDLKTCNAFRGTGKSIKNIDVPMQTPSCIEVYVNEQTVNNKNALAESLKKLFLEFKLGETDFEFIDEVLYEQAKESWRSWE